MTTLFTVLIVLAAIILILVVLVQKSKGGGLSSSFASSNAIMGVHKTTDVVEKITWGLAGFIMLMSILVVMMTPKENAVDAGAPVPTAAPIEAPALPDMTPAMPTTTPEQSAPAVPTTTPAPALPTPESN